MQISTHTSTVVRLAGALLLGGCAGDGLLGAGERATLSVQLTDAPADLAEANVRIERIVLDRIDAGSTEDDRVELTPASSDWIDLLTLSGGTVQDLASTGVPIGSYGNIRLIVCEMYIRTEAGEVVATPGSTLPSGVTATPGMELKLTSQCESGFRVNIASGQLALSEGENVLVIDFDAHRSFAHQAGRSGKWVVTPVLHGVRADRGGRIAGTVAFDATTLPATCGGETLDEGVLRDRFVPTATAGDVVRTGATSGADAFRISHLAPGTYTLGVDPVAFGDGDLLTFTATATPAESMVTAGETAAANFLVTGVSCTPAD